MIPTTIKLMYPDNFRPLGDPEAFLPGAIHTRPGASKILVKVVEGGKLVRATVSSEYDALRDIVIEIDVVGNVGHVQNAWFQESK